MMALQTLLKSTLKDKYQKVGVARSENLLLPLRLGNRSPRAFASCNLNQHEFRHVDKSDLHTWVEFQTIPLADIFSCDCKHDSSKRTVITLGVSGVGKTTTVQMCALDWAEGNAYSGIHLLFPLTFWELNLLQRKLSLIELLQMFYPELKDFSVSSLNKNNVWIVLDGLDEYCLPLDFGCRIVDDVSKVSTVDDLVINLIRGNLLPKAHIWITTRYAASTRIPECHLLKGTEVKVFSDVQKEQRFKTLLGSDALANKAIDHVKISRSLDYLCQIPPICTIMATVLKNHVVADNGYKISPLNLTQIYTNLVKESKSDVLNKLKKLALRRFEKGNVLYEKDLLESGICVREASEFSKECPLVLREEKGLDDTTVFRFGHTSIQEFLAAASTLDNIETHHPSLFCQRLVDQTLKSTNGKFDVLLRFVFGLIKERGTLEPTDQLFDYTKKKILENIVSPSAVILFHCLREFNAQALLDEVKFYLKTDLSPIQGFTPMHWRFMIQRSTNFEGMRDCFKMQVPLRCDDRFLRHLPCILKSRKAMLRFSNLTDKCCPALAAVLSTKESYLRELDLGYNSISDNGAKELAKGLTDENCRLKTLRLQGCEMTSQGCKYLSAALRHSRKLQELDLSGNEIGDDGLKQLSNGLRAPECHLEALKLSQCNIEHKGCQYLASALQKNSAHLRVLDLSSNMIRDKGANVIFRKVDVTKLTKLELCNCALTWLSCQNIGNALKHVNSNLVELNLSNNNLQDVGIVYIGEGMYPWCSLERLNVSSCGITAVGSFYLGKVLCSVSQFGPSKGMTWLAVELQDLDLSMNCLTDNGVKEISAGLWNPLSHLKTLNLSHCYLTDECCAELASSLASDRSVITELDLSGNSIQDKGVKKLCVGLRTSQCKLEKLSLKTCGLTQKSIQYLTSALKSNPVLVAELHLMGNRLEESGIRYLTELTKNPKYALHTIDISAD